MIRSGLLYTRPTNLGNFSLILEIRLYMKGYI